jgi:hypothetical protein
MMPMLNRLFDKDHLLPMRPQRPFAAEKKFTRHEDSITDSLRLAHRFDYNERLRD